MATIWSTPTCGRRHAGREGEREGKRSIHMKRDVGMAWAWHRHGRNGKRGGGRVAPYHNGQECKCG